MIKEELKFENSNIFEGMTSVSAVLNADSAINDRKIEKVMIYSENRKKKAPEIGFLTAKSKEMGFPIEFTDEKTITSFAIGSSHGGILAFCSDRTIPKLTKEALDSNGFYVYLDGIEDPYNFGNAIRSLYAAGISAIIVPERNWMTAAGVVARSSAGTSEKIPIYSASSELLIEVFQEKKIPVYCAGIRDSVSVFDEDIKYPLLLVVGGEKRGISKKILEKADKVLRIDYAREFRGSLSAAASCAVLAYEIYRKNR